MNLKRNRHRMAGICVAAAAITPSLLFCQPKSSDTAADRAMAHLNQLLGESESPGVQYAFASADSVIFSFTGGSANLASNIPVTDATTFMGFSVTKTFTALAVLQLDHEGKLSLDDPISRYLDYFPYEQSPTIRQTLNHTGGFPNPIPISWSHTVERHRSFDRRRFIRDVMERNPRLQAEPGERFGYSNIGYLLLGEVIEKASGMIYEDYVMERIIRPLSLRSGESLSFEIPNGNLHSSGYLERLSLLNIALGWFLERDEFIKGHYGRWNQFHHFYVNGSAYGGLIGNAGGFIRYLQELLHPGGSFADFTPELFGPASKIKGEEIPVTMAWFRGSLNGKTYYAHAGGGGGYYCEIRIYPELRRASVILFNRSGIRDERFLDRVDSIFLGK